MSSQLLEAGLCRLISRAEGISVGGAMWESLSPLPLLCVVFYRSTVQESSLYSASHSVVENAAA